METLDSTHSQMLGNQKNILVLLLLTVPGKIIQTDTYADSGRFTSYETFGTVTENDTGYILPSVHGVIMVER